MKAFCKAGSRYLEFHLYSLAYQLCQVVNKAGSCKNLGTGLNCWIRQQPQAYTTPASLHDPQACTTHKSARPAWMKL